MKYLKIFTDFAEELDDLSDAECGRLFRAMLEYAESETVPELKGNERFKWTTARKQIDNQRKSYFNKVAGAEKARNFASDIRVNQTDCVCSSLTSEQEKEKDKEQEQDKEKKKKCIAHPRFTPPTAADVEAYCMERGNRVDAERFVDFYTSKGWKVGKEPMKDWKAAVRTWEKTNEHITHKSRKAQELDDAYAMSERWANG